MDKNKPNAFKGCVVTLEMPGYKKQYWIEEYVQPDGLRRYQNHSQVIVSDPSPRISKSPKVH